MAELARGQQDQVDLQAALVGGRQETPGAERLVVRVCGHDDEPPYAVERQRRPVRPPGVGLPDLGGRAGPVVGERRARGHHGDAPLDEAAQRGGVALGVVLAEVEPEVGDPGGVLVLGRERGRPERVVGREQDRLGGVGDDLAGPGRGECGRLARDPPAVDRLGRRQQHGRRAR